LIEADIYRFLNDKTPSDPNFKPLNKLIEAVRGGAIFTTNGNFTVPAGVNTIFVTATAAGGDGTAGAAGSGAGNGRGGSGGDCGRYVINFPISVTPGEVIPITVGSDSTLIGTKLALAKGGIGYAGTPINGDPVPGRIGDGYNPRVGTGGAAGGSYSGGGAGGNACHVVFVPIAFGMGKTSNAGNGGNAGTPSSSGPSAGGAGQGFGNGGGGGGGSSSTGGGAAGGAGAPGVVVIKW